MNNYMFCSKSLRLVHIEAIFNARAKARLTVCLLEHFRIAGDITFCLLWTVEKFGGALLQNLQPPKGITEKSSSIL